MELKLRGTNVIGIELLIGGEGFQIDKIKQFLLEKKQLLKGARLVLTVENYKLSPEELEELLKIAKELDGVTFCGFKTNVKENRELCIGRRIPCDLSTLQVEREKERSESEEIKFVKKTLRSGDKLTSTGDLIIMGDVNPGAEVEAGGNIYVMGSIRGLVRAGIGKSEGEVRALFFSAPRIEVCGKNLSFERGEEFVNFRAKVKSGKIKIEHSKRGS
ncbi:septum site-determining protein MinC [Thermovibrio ammonificans]|jgi:septum site-determining protein MinC|uniref:Probable septum site-determining protein MinC n=1 Tax=Thermovibrio ammonificans (strain DSM 15698 / JCM 12110 / HB-1) TaxID=648996 RepID=E8T4C7_THEA1|nr:septum site-determining protein MinC [Thermovibrio ammonificans]ADU96262.1 Septum formation inhibitor MinC [Thermovibrio ammonificans HB-1]